MDTDPLAGGSTGVTNYGAITQDRNTAISSTSSSSGFTQDDADNLPRSRVGSWFARLPSPSLKLVNNGSVARDHLASERTFMAYVRTSLAISSMGTALAQLFRLSEADAAYNLARPLGASLIVMGIMVLILGCLRYFIVQSSLIQGKFPTARVSLAVLSTGLIAFVSIIFGVLLADKDSQ
ncbi:hypothetical protein PUNSTDRAFT_49779 [Punctularia strigosozonata HHB-11173 SS5]|uniref:uncharacterized protein n=1 Tax=Punctularia strigosozonata (strain HHB-11173) TaxID=741275 RepID=UPI00044185CC|nr:uncharacterized protein PUNSTDRAFT_49779 [Punctularia strigosozonata HHB-11173 SS5]EIN12475.1 hypothetical protein PUNSTDRAFT_49779 [Punctularia strigosozonata HHB-11173 SS5]